jgi:DNA polymerase-3 subunit delta
MLNAEAISQKTGSPKKGKKNKAKATTDLLIAKNPKNPYPIYLLLKKSDGFSKDKLISAVEVLAEADKKLKTSAQSPKLVLEKAILSVCKM